MVFQEIPNEISLAFEITNCRHNCDGCHSPWLKEDVGFELTPDVIKTLLEMYGSLITTILFLGGEDNELIEIIKQLKPEYPNLKMAVYSGNDIFNQELGKLIDFYKIGHYDKKLGGLDSKLTNQRFWVKNCGIYIDKTNIFRSRSDK